MDKSIKYYGEWQQGSSILQRLEGPYGQGSVEFADGNRFEGCFYLSFASIQGPCYAAKGRYSFADGSYIDNCWILTADKVENFRGLHGVYEVKNCDGSPRSITSFRFNKRHGIELQLASMQATEWYDGEPLHIYTALSHKFTHIDDDRSEIKVELSNNITIEIVSGRLSQNSYGAYYFEPMLEGRIYYPNGDIYSSINYNIRNLKPYSGNGTMLLADGSIYHQSYNCFDCIEQQCATPATPPKEPCQAPSSTDSVVVEYKWLHTEWDIGGKEDCENDKGLTTLHTGFGLEISGFKHIKVVKITPEQIDFSNSSTLTKGGSLYLSNSIDGYEGNDGSVWNGDNYDLTLYWR